MKNGAIYLVTLSLLVTTALPVAYSKKAIAVQPGPVKVKQGNNVSLWCKLSDDSRNEGSLRVHWQSPPKFRTRTSNCLTFGSAVLKEKYVMSCAKNNSRWYNMTIINVQWADKGIYRCIHNGDEDSVKLLVFVPVTNVSLTYTSSSKNTIVLTCTTNCAYPALNISWYQNNLPFNGSLSLINTESECTENEMGQKRTISKVTVRRTGLGNENKESNISCKANNVLGEKNVSSRKIINFDALPVAYSKKAIAVQPGPVKVKQGNNVSLWCKLLGDSRNEGSLHVHWQSPPKFRTRTSNCLTFGSAVLKRKYVMSCAKNNSWWYNMTIMNVQWADKGIYRCIHNGDEDSVQLLVFVPVINVSLTYASSSKNTIVLTCTTNCAYPAPNISWYQNNLPFNGSLSLINTESECTENEMGQKRTISKVTVRRTGLGNENKESNISCKANNVLGEKNVSSRKIINFDALPVAYPNKAIAVQQGPVKVKQGNNVSLWCKLSDDPRNEGSLHVHWQSPPKFRTRTSNCLTFGSAVLKQKYVMSCAKNHSWWYIMTIMNVQWADKGRYRCIHNGDEDSVKLLVFVPVINVSLIYTSSSKNTIVLTCTTNCAYPAPSILWRQNNFPFTGGANVENTESECTGNEMGQKRTISKLTVRRKYLNKEVKSSNFFCTVEDVFGEKTISSRIFTYDGRVCRKYSHNTGYCVCGPPDLCKDHHKQACGFDGTMYSSLCELYRVACITHKHIDVDYTGYTCKPKASPSPRPYKLNLFEYLVIGVLVVGVVIVPTFVIVFKKIKKTKVYNEMVQLKLKEVVDQQRKPNSTVTMKYKSNRTR